MNEPQTILALDVGERRIGIAMASLTAQLPSAFKTIQRGDDVFKIIGGIAKEHNSSIIVVGLPRGLSGQETDQTVLTREFAAELQKALPDTVIVMQDEAGTSIEAEELLKLHGKAFDNADIDAHAASLILRDYLQHTVGQST